MTYFAEGESLVCSRSCDAVASCCTVLFDAMNLLRGVIKRSSDHGANIAGKKVIGVTSAVYSSAEKMNNSYKLQAVEEYQLNCYLKLLSRNNTNI